MIPNTSPDDRRIDSISRRKTLGLLSAGAGTVTMSGAGIGTIADRALAQIETCDATLDVVLALDYSGSIRSAGTWGDIRSGATDFVDELSDDNQIGLVTFGDAPKAYDFDEDEYLVQAQDGQTDNRGTVASVIPDTAPPTENGTHMPGALDLANAILDEQGRGEKEVIILLTDGEPNYENGLVGDGAAPPADDGDGNVAGVVGWSPSQSDSFDPDGDSTANTFDYTGGNTGGEDASITDGERNETAEVAAIARGDSEYTKMNGDTVSVTPSPPTRLLTVGIGGADDTYLSTKVASAPDDHVSTTAANIGTELVALLEDLCNSPCVVSLVAGQHTDVGTVELTLDGETLTVTYTTTGDWYLRETHLDVQEDFCDFPLAGKSNPKVGRFAHSGIHDDVRTVSYQVDVSSFDNDGDDITPPPYLVAAHAVVERSNDGEQSDSDDESDRNDTAWGGGCRFNRKGGNWATFIVFDPSIPEACGCPEEYDRPTCENEPDNEDDDGRESEDEEDNNGRKGRGKGNGRGNR
jgi:hypothetical protein